MDILNAMDALNAGNAKVLEWQKKFMTDWYGPMMDMMLVQTAKQITGMDPMAQAMLRAKHPDGMQVIDRLAGGG